jgi:hypothetical protein
MPANPERVLELMKCEAIVPHSRLWEHFDSGKADFHGRTPCPTK